MKVVEIRGKLGNMTKVAGLEGRRIDGYWGNENGDKVDGTFFGDRVFYYVKGRHYVHSFNVKVTLTIAGQEEVMMDACVSNVQKGGEDLCLASVKVKDRWELDAGARNERTGKLNCWVTVDSPVFCNDHSDGLAVSEFKVENDFIVDGPGFKKTVALPCGKFSQQVHAIVLHRTDSETISSPLNSASRAAAAHFYVDKNGDLYHKISLGEIAPHVGRIRRRGEPNVQSSSAILQEEKKKSYPERFPFNDDSVGIEVVGKHLVREIYRTVKGVRETVEEEYYVAPVDIEQIKSVARLVNFLTGHFSLNKNEDIYGHEIISSKAKGEGETVYEAIKPYLL